VTHNCDLVDLKLLDQATGQPMTKHGVNAGLVLSSAHYEADGTLTEVLKRAQEKGWPVHEWCWRECLEPHGWLAPAEIVRTQSIVTKAMWKVQYDLQEPSPEGRAIDPEKVERMFVGELIVGASADEFTYAEFEAPVAGATYATGLDNARTTDYVEIVTLRSDCLPLRLVAYQRFRKRPMPYILAQFQHQTTRFQGSAAHDKTGLGGLFMDDMITVPEDTIVDGVVMTGAPRTQLFTDYIIAIEHEEIVSPRIDLLYRQHKFVRNKDLWRHDSTGHPPDGFVAGALAYKASQSASRPLRLLGRPSVPPGRAAGDNGHAPGPPPTSLARALALLGGGNGHHGGNGTGGTNGQ